jgi:uncharacterized caspase-like protein
MTSRAVIVGIDDYTVLDPSGQTNLAHAAADARSVYYLLRNGFGFSEIYYLENLQATRPAILRAFRHLVSVSEPGDSLCCYFSGHGARVRADLSQPECGTYFEALVPASGDATGYLLTDQDIKEVTDDLSPDAVNVTVLTDACHSGGFLPDEAGLAVRCPTFEDALLERIAANLTTLVPFGLGIGDTDRELAGNVSNVHVRGGLIDLDPDPDRTLVAAARCTVLSACRFDESSWESDPAGHGLFTAALLDVLLESPYTASYAELLTALQPVVQRRLDSDVRPAHPEATQTPQLFGQRNRMDQPFLAGWSYTPAVP